MKKVLLLLAVLILGSCTNIKEEEIIDHFLTSLLPTIVEAEAGDIMDDGLVAADRQIKPSRISRGYIKYSGTDYWIDALCEESMISISTEDYSIIHQSIKSALISVPFNLWYQDENVSEIYEILRSGRNLILWRYTPEYEIEKIEDRFILTINDDTYRDSYNIAILLESNHVYLCVLGDSNSFDFTIAVNAQNGGRDPADIQLFGVSSK